MIKLFSLKQKKAEEQAAGGGGDGSGSGTRKPGMTAAQIRLQKGMRSAFQSVDPFQESSRWLV